MFARARALVLSGRVRQLGISERFTVEFPDSIVRLFSKLLEVNPSPYIYAFQYGTFALVGSSPRSLIRVQGNTVTLRPVGGTKPRPADRNADAEAVGALLSDSKEVGEHLMLLEAWVSDLSRITQPETIHVTGCLQPERFSHVIHLGSTISGQLAAGMEAIDALRSVLPAPTVVGVPKAEAIQAIEELESDRRGIYGGAIGRVGTDGSMDMYIALRTAIVQDGRLHVQAGAGVVRESREEYEHQEILNKVGAMLAAVDGIQECGRIDAQRQDRPADGEGI
jgi:anthranilate synthase component 1